MDELGRRTSDAFRKKHHLLTSEEIKELRMSLNMSQRQFAAFLRVGVASVKRWENWKVQDASSDELIRLKCMMAKAEAGQASVSSKH
jgi:DNA-binding transcriptional regulator YiaG